MPSPRQTKWMRKVHLPNLLELPSGEFIRRDQEWMLMEIGAAMMAGVVGVAATTIIHNMLPIIGLPRVNIAGVLGTWLLNPGGRAAVVGIMLHFAFGAAFGLIYAWLWSLGIGAITYQWGIMFGAVHGLVAAAILPILLHLFPRPKEMLEGPITLVALFVLHVLFGLVVSLQYRALVD